MLGDGVGAYPGGSGFHCEFRFDLARGRRRVDFWDALTIVHLS